ncbi:copper resistance CopC/CopD family protein [Catellatospora methionotrophica]|uniref:copper resistance CopC/CopD family protein n=1 Tax=Catellatospora methionotrophica TaxID=121620 RepID=UPI0033F1C90B
MSRAGGLVLAAVAFAVALTVPATAAHAHAALLRTNPPVGSVVAQAPEQVLLTFSESITAVPGKIRIVGPDGERADRDTPTVAGNILSITLRDSPRQGTYLVSYRVVSADSHPIPGGFTFSIGVPSAAPAGSDADEVDATVSSLLTVAKTAGYVGLVMLVGPVLVLSMLWPRRLSQRAPRRLMWAGFGVCAATTVAGLYLQAPYTTGTGLAGVSIGDLADVAGSTYGLASLARLVLLAAAAVLVRPLLDGRDRQPGRIALLVVAALAALTWPVTGHPAASPVPAVSVAIDAVHLAGAAVWLGGLLMLAGWLLRLSDEGERAAILPIWSRWASLAVASVLLAGTVSALIQIGTPTALVGTAYGRLVMVKVGLVAAVLAAAFVARRLAAGAALSRPGGLRRVVFVELAVTAVVLATTGVLTQTTPARTAEQITQGVTEQQSYTATLTSPLYTLQVEISPMAVGENVMHLYAYTAQGTQLPVVQWTATAALPSAGIEPVDLAMLRLTDNHASAQFVLPTPGRWELRFTLRLSDIDQASVTTTVEVGERKPGRQ